jgi:hypothetical protein
VRAGVVDQDVQARPVRGDLLPDAARVAQESEVGAEDVDGLFGDRPRLGEGLGPAEGDGADAVAAPGRLEGGEAAQSGGGSGDQGNGTIRRTLSS